jgi:hypothetical protein
MCECTPTTLRRRFVRNTHRQRQLRQTAALEQRVASSLGRIAIEDWADEAVFGHCTLASDVGKRGSVGFSIRKQMAANKSVESQGPALSRVRRVAMSGISVRHKPELPTNDLTQRIGDLTVPRHWRLLTGGGITVDVVTLAVSMKHAASRCQFPDEFPPLHTSNSNGRRSAVDGIGGRS